MDSILTSVKKLLGIQEDYTIFDTDLILYINTVLAILTQIGIGPSTGFLISDSTATWSDFVGTDPRLELVKTYTYLKVKMMFDTPDRATVSDAYTKLLDELEYRLMVNNDIISKEDSSNE